MARAARWELAALGDTAPPDWVHSAFYIGVIQAYLATRQPFYRDAARRWADASGWQLYPAKGPRFADNQACAHVHLELYLEGPRDPAMLAAGRAAIDAMLADPRPGRVDWWWCDALFMAPPVLARLTTATGDPRYLDLMDRMFWDTRDHLFCDPRGLFYRDANYLGGEVFWSRGNGWVMAAIPLILEHIPAGHPHRPDYLALLRRMAEAVLPLQGPDGAWRASLLDPSAFPGAETSGTGLIVCGLARGIALGALERERYLPAASAGWRALLAATSPEGRLGRVQPRGHEPGPAGEEDHSPFGTGALLLAGSALLSL
jgi:unsaturated rhamnogalacturonyl hydrolase